MKFVEAFSQVDATVIGRYNGDMEHVADHLSGNVHFFKWLPQNDLLGDPKTRLFLTHCGNNGQYEAIYHGVPMLGFPLFGEQEHNCFRMVDHKLGLQLDIREFTSHQLLETMNEVLHNPLYANEARRKSAIIKDRPQTAKETVGHWVEHVIQYGGDHLRSRALDMPWYEYLMLDIMLLCAVCTTTVSYLLIKLTNLLIPRLSFPF